MRSRDNYSSKRQGLPHLQHNDGRSVVVHHSLDGGLEQTHIA